MPGQERRPNPNRRRRRRRRINDTAIIFWLVVVLVVVGSVAVIISITRGNDDNKGGAQMNRPSQITGPSTSPTEGSTGPVLPPPVTKVSTATVAATGDMLMHMPCIEPALNGTTGEYDFRHYFQYVQDYVQSADYAVANLETTLCGLDNGYKYHGYPNFNCPDGIVPSLQDVGFDMLLTANNHTYDTSSAGFFRTQQVLASAGMDHIGTKPAQDADDYLVKEINGIRVGMVCYTYETDADLDDVRLNAGPVLPSNVEPLINTFHQNDVAGFTDDLRQDIGDMKADGAEAIVLYIHWGDEYQLKQNSTQTKFAQVACDLGVDVIVGGHPHVIQPMELLTSTQDSDHQTVCLYSTGNALSNQRKDLMNLNTGHTEDGVLFSFTFAKYSDGTVRVEDVELLPLWIYKHTDIATGKNVYDILPLDTQIEDWKSQFRLSDSVAGQLQASYDRTMKIVGTGLEQIRTHLDSLPEVA